MDIVRCQVDEDTGLYIAARVDVEGMAAAGDTASHIRGVVPEVNCENGLLIAHPARSPSPHEVPLLRGGHQAGVGIEPHRDIEKMPPDKAALLQQHIVKFVAHDGINIVAGKL
jgi:hypothetical protein